MARSGRRRFEDFLTKFEGCYRSVEVRAICGKWEGELRNILTRLEFSPEPQSALQFPEQLPDTDSVKAVHAVFPASEGRRLMTSIEAGLLECEGEGITYLQGDYPIPPAHGVSLGGYYDMLRVVTPGEPRGTRPWSYAQLIGRGIQLTDCLAGNHEDVRRQLRSLDSPYRDLAHLLRRFGSYSNRFSSIPRDSRVDVRAPLMLRFVECNIDAAAITVAVEGAPAFAKMPARIAVFSESSDGSQSFSFDLPKEGWEERGDLVMLTTSFPVKCRADDVVALQVGGHDADEYHWRSEQTSDDELEEPLSQKQHPVSSREVFVVHGRDEDALRAVEQVIRSLGLEPVVLYKQPNQGRTVIEQFEKHSDVGFAVVLLTPDDLAHNKKTPKEIEERARQNVILELGYFMAKLGRDCVCALKKGEVDRPSDIHDVLYVEMDEGGAWREQLAQEMREAGLTVRSSIGESAGWKLSEVVIQQPPGQITLEFDSQGLPVVRGNIIEMVVSVINDSGTGDEIGQFVLCLLGALEVGQTRTKAIIKAEPHHDEAEFEFSGEPPAYQKGKPIPNNQVVTSHLRFDMKCRRFRKATLAHIGQRKIASAPLKFGWNSVRVLKGE